MCVFLVGMSINTMKAPIFAEHRMKEVERRRQPIYSLKVRIKKGGPRSGRKGGRREQKKACKQIEDNSDATLLYKSKYVDNI